MRITNPLTGNKEHIATVLKMMASQENCDGEPYDQMQDAAEYILDLEQLLKHTQRVYPTSGWARSRDILLSKEK